MIKKALSFIFLLAAASIAAAQPTPSPTPARTAPPVPHTNLKVGDKAPDFTLPSTTVGADGKGVRFKLSDFKRTVVKDYGIFNEEGGYGNRATFVVDKDGVIQHIDEGSVAIDPTSAEDACNILTHKKATQ